ncbi:sensor domain-containing diguanylate cyclase [Uliginosibacterium sp. H1]|uniref:sensor domain-containing diguanylate cyclase n=1 Tax=Uliginosibacterium sp. H1 TaxID=3114757 RepID=UPI002E18AC14|nr:diguanylate cyclase [Uliginosibacterium sp. H1]
MITRLLSRLSPAARVTLGLVSLALTLLLIFDLVLGVFPSGEKQILQNRQRLAEITGVQVAALISSDGQRHLPPVLNALAARDRSLRSIGVRNAEGVLLSSTEGHAENWQRAEDKVVGRNQFIIPIRASGQSGERWGQVELVFQPISVSLLRHSWLSPTVKLILLFSLTAGAIFYLYLRRTFQHLDPSAAVPARVQSAFDAMNEAVLVLDANRRIVMHNNAFEALLPERGEPVVGRDPASFSWLVKGIESASDTPTWVECLESREAVTGVPYEAHTTGGNTRRLTVNASPVLDARNTLRGCMVSFSDVTELEESRIQLVSLMTELSASKEQLEVQNQELQRLASVDAMTGVLNRRAFFPRFEAAYKDALTRNMQFSFVMCDIDKFKTINDVYGHPAGDRVIQAFASVLQRTARDTDIVCRYGGEEFCVALPLTDPRQALAFAERVREQVDAELRHCIELTDRTAITASFGVAALGMGNHSAAELADQADQALYHSKNNGRNRCTVYSRIIAAQQDKQADARPA